ncbi:MAG: hypothetical protein QW097_01950 [archaeon]
MNFDKNFFKKEAKEWIAALVFAILLYYVVLPLFLHTSSPAIVIASCSEKGFLNIGDIIFVQGGSLEELNAPTVNTVNFTPVFVNNTFIGLNFSGLMIYPNQSNDIAVYYSPYGFQVIHRVLVKINDSGNFYLITRGDANNFPDQVNYLDKSVCFHDLKKGCISTAVNQKMYVGKKIFVAIPLLGHIKLFFCDLTGGIFCEGHSNFATNYEYKLSC